MAADRPDLWTVAEAFENLTAMFAYLAGLDESGVVTIGGFCLQKFYSPDDGAIEYQLQRQVLSMDIDMDEFDSFLYDYTGNSTLCNIGLDVPTLDTDE